MLADPVQTLSLRGVDHGGNPRPPEQTAQALASFIAAAVTSIAVYDFRRSDSLAAPVVTALTEVAARGVTVRIGYDAGKPDGGTAATFTLLEADPAPVGTAACQMDPIVAQWQSDSHDSAVLIDFRAVAAHLSAKHSAPYTPSGLHNFMHGKILVIDSQVTTGSYNLSANAERNAENQVHLTDPSVVADYTAYIAVIATEYAT